MTAEQKVIVITGASRGIGAQLSKAYRQIGYQVIANSRSMRESNDPAILAIEGDISPPETAERILGPAAERFGRIDTLVNNAGVFIAKSFTEYSEDPHLSAAFNDMATRGAAEFVLRDDGAPVMIIRSKTEQVLLKVTQTELFCLALEI